MLTLRTENEWCTYLESLEETAIDTMDGLAVVKLISYKDYFDMDNSRHTLEHFLDKGNGINIFQFTLDVSGARYFVAIDED